MATLEEYFEIDFVNALTFFYDLSISINHTERTQVNVKIGTDSYSGAKFVVYYVPQHSACFAICCSLLGSLSDAIHNSSGVHTEMNFPGDINLGLIGSTYSVFSKRVYIYTEWRLTAEELTRLDSFGKASSLMLTIRGADYVTNKARLETPLAFLSHDSRDKEDVAVHIALGLEKLMCRVWYDEFSLKVGDHLRESIEKGLKEARKCILVISPNFISNPGWTRAEFDSIFTRELIERTSVILPVWYKVTQHDVYRYSPSLANRFALDWSKLGRDEVVKRLYHVVNAHE